MNKKIINAADRIAAYGLFSICGGMWILFDTNYVYMSLIIPYSALCQIIDLSCMFFFPICIIIYTLTNLEIPKVKQKIKILLFVIVIINIISFSVQLLNYKDLYELQSYAVINNSFSIVFFLYYSLKEVKNY